MVAPIFKFRNIKVKLSTADPTFVYGLNEFNFAFPGTLEDEIEPAEISTVLLSVQISNLTGGVGFPTPAQTVSVSAFMQRSGILTYSDVNSRSLVLDYPLVSNNSFDPLGGNLVLSWDELNGGDQLWLKTSVANSCDVIVSLLEIANATAN